MIYDVPGYVLAIIVIIITLIYSIVAFLIVENWIPATIRKRNNDATSPIVGIIVAILLAFVVVVTWQQYTVTDSDISREAGIVEDVWRQAYGYPEPLKTEVRNGIENYINTVINIEWPLMRQGKYSIQAWNEIGDVERQIFAFQPTTIAEQQIQDRQLTTINTAINSRRNRLYNLTAGLDKAMWIVIILSSALCIASIWFLGADCRILHIIGLLIIGISIGLLLYIIIDINYPFRGSISIGTTYFETILTNLDRIQQRENMTPNPYVAP